MIQFNESIFFKTGGIKPPTRKLTWHMKMGDHPLEKEIPIIGSHHLLGFLAVCFFGGIVLVDFFWEKLTHFESHMSRDHLGQAGVVSTTTFAHR